MGWFPPVNTFSWKVLAVNSYSEELLEGRERLRGTFILEKRISHRCGPHYVIAR